MLDGIAAKETIVGAEPLAVGGFDELIELQPASPTTANRMSAAQQPHPEERSPGSLK
jgi:hypothetical protein